MNKIILTITPEQAKKIWETLWAGIYTYCKCKELEYGNSCPVHGFIGERQNESSMDFLMKTATKFLSISEPSEIIDFEEGKMTRLEHLRLIEKNDVRTQR